jgi:hypothetical protein
MKSFKKLIKETFTDKDFERVVTRKKVPIKGQIRGDVEKYVDALEKALMSTGETTKLTAQDLDSTMQKVMHPEKDMPTADPKDVEDAPGGDDHDVSGLFDKGPSGKEPGKMPSLKKVATGDGPPPLPTKGGDVDKSFDKTFDIGKEPEMPKSSPMSPSTAKNLTVHSSPPESQHGKGTMEPLRGTDPSSDLEPDFDPMRPNAKPGQSAALPGQYDVDTDKMDKLKKALSSKDMAKDTKKKLNKSLAGKPQMPKQGSVKFDKGSPFLDPKAAKRADKKGFLPTLKKLAGKK